MTVVFSVSDSGNGFPETKYNLLLINFIEYPIQKQVEVALDYPL
jgi:hypothetical protein